MNNVSIYIHVHISGNLSIDHTKFTALLKLAKSPFHEDLLYQSIFLTHNKEEKGAQKYLKRLHSIFFLNLFVVHHILIQAEKLEALKAESTILLLNIFFFFLPPSSSSISSLLVNVTFVLWL